MVRKKETQSSIKINNDSPESNRRDQEIQTTRSMESFESCISTETIRNAFGFRSQAVQTDSCSLSLSSFSASTSSETSLELAHRPSEFRVIVEEDKDITDTDLDTTQPPGKCPRFMNLWKLVRWYLLLAILYATLCYLLQHYSMKHPAT